jgi:diaminohydroxyphosphoribosylaminopyrimidine deaminase/5-amino-6-(5-phosphoribosylamino)uracil reductase
MTQNQHENYMRRCLELAVQGLGHTAPNPMVGAVLVCNGRIAGEGYHRQYGSAHAEPEAISTVKDASLLRNSTLYVNLEPCSHFGKTPPCAQLIIDRKIPRIYIGVTDPFPAVDGRGIRMLQAAGVEVTTGLLETECEALNKRFLTFHRRRRPYVFLKWAQSVDGFLDAVRTLGDGRMPVRFSGKQSLMAVHRMRAQESAVLVGTRTALLDNPSLTVRHWPGRHPLRIVIDKDLRIPAGHHLLDGQAATLVLTRHAVEDRPLVQYRRLDFDVDILPQIMACLYEMNIQSLIVEGGAHLLNSFLSAGLWDEMIVETAPIRLGTGLPAPVPSVPPVDVRRCEKSIVTAYRNPEIR